MKSLLARILTVLAIGLATTLASAADTITVLTWEEFISPKVLASFRNRENLVVKVLEFSTIDEREQILREQGDQIDVVVADTVWSMEYERRGILEKLDQAKIPSLKHAIKHWKANTDYAVPYLWGHTGIAWRTDLVKTPLQTYGELFALAKANPGKVSLLDDPHEALRAALYAFGKAPYAMNTPTAVKQATTLLQPYRKQLRIVGSELDEKSPWLDGSLMAGQAFNGDIAYLRDTFKAPLAFAVPSPGCMVFHEQLVLLKSAKNKDAAYRFLALITEPTYAARNAMQVRYAPSNPLAVLKLTEAFRNDPIIRPTFDGMDGCYFYNYFDTATQAALDAVKL